MILETPGGYDLVLAGLDRIAARSGDQLLAGEPIGTMPQYGTGERLYFEVQHNGKGMSPVPWLEVGLEESEAIMKRYAFVGLGMVAGFAAAVMLFPVAQGAADNSAYRQLDLFGDAFERVRANYVRPVQESELVDNAIQGHGLLARSAFRLHECQGLCRHADHDQGQFGGLGLEVTMQDGLVKVISPIDDTPASRAGIKAGRFHRGHQWRPRCKAPLTG